MKKGFLYTIIFVLYYNICFGQDPTFSQYYSNRLYLNPAFAGTANCPRLTLNYRNQWPGIDNGFVTYAASFDKQVESINGGFGIQLFNDQAGEGVLRTTSAAFMYSYQIKVKRNFSIRAGFQATAVQKAINLDNLRFGDMIDARRGFIYESQEQIQRDNVIYPDFSFGLLGFSRKTYFGLAAHHITVPDEGFIGLGVLERRFTAHFGGNFSFGIRNADMKWSPNVIYQIQGAAQERNVGMYISKGPLVAGLWYRNATGVTTNRDAVITLLGVETNDFKIGYSFDYTISQLNGQTNGAHEISLSYIFPCSPKPVRFETINCPSF